MSARSVRGVMAQVLVALIPAISVHTYLFGPGIFIQLILAISFALALEAAMLFLRRKPLMAFLSDGSAIVAAVLFALSVPPLAPWWISATGMVFAIVIAKQLYGGLGSNVFNPAMVGFAAVIIAFPQAMTRWLIPSTLGGTPPDWASAWQAILTGQLAGSTSWDTLSQATPLDLVRSGRLNHQTLSEIMADPRMGEFISGGWEWMALAYLAGGLYLLFRKIIQWQVPVTVLVGTLLLTLPGWLMDGDVFRSPLHQLTAGSLVMCAFFIATDPVSGSGTPRGKIIFSLGIVILTLAIRAWGGFPDGVAFAVLLMNVCVPLIDHYTRPKVFGHNTHTQDLNKRSNTS